MTERDYILGTHDAEIERLLLQHRVWRPRMLDAWRRAGIRQNQTVIDAGCGPGYASLDLAEIVGAKGSVIAVERSARFLAALKDAAAQRGLTNIRAVEADITETPLGEAVADAAWCRWVFAWLARPELGVRNLARAMKSSGVVVFHEYLNYRTWSLIPHEPAFTEFVDAVTESIARTGASVDAAVVLPSLLEQEGFDIVTLNPIVDVVGPENYVWQWPLSFARGYRDKLVADGVISASRADEALAQLARAETAPGIRMVTPVVLEIIARRR
jgi:ubiquinone/menaquinone biosynthesis C-methylase UbiE